MEEERPGPLPKRFGFLTAILLIAVLGGVALRAGRSDTEVFDPTRPGEPAPDFTVDLIDGGTFTLSEHFATDGRPVLLNFWAFWCGPCRVEMPDLDSLAADKPGLLVLGIAVDGPTKDQLAFADEIGVSYPLGLDETEVISAAYPHIGLPANWLIGEDGIIRWRVFGQLNRSWMDEIVLQELGF